MERMDLNLVDDSFELFEGVSSSEISESFELFEGDEKDKATTDATTDATKPKIDTEKLTQTLGAVGSAGASAFQVYKAYENPQKASVRQAKKQKKLELWEVCGNKPLFGKDKKTKYATCVSEYNAGKIGNVPQQQGGGAPPPPPPTGMSNNTKILIAVAVIGVAGFLYWKFFKGGKTAS